MVGGSFRGDVAEIPEPYESSGSSGGPRGIAASVLTPDAGDDPVLMLGGGRGRRSGSAGFSSAVTSEPRPTPSGETPQPD
ncbi:hypothetical protein GCM10009843_03540 [Nocardioides bigeumensis]|uniref:Uncharacterized protein n=1 Tax=Nocardioides bigeumensis TaxID=433657 RepID=A0ABP5JCG8_9ACTN